MEQERLVPQELPAGLDALLGPYLVRQRWYAGDKGAAPATVVLESGLLAELAEGKGRLWWAIVSAGGSPYQVVIGERPATCVGDHLRGHEDATLGALGDNVFFDAVFDSEMAVALLGAVGTGEIAVARRARPLGAEQSNTSLIYDDRVILKLFRRLSDGPNPDVDITSALAEAGFSHIAQPLVRWRHGGRDLAFGQQYLAGGTDGWALALTSLRDYYGAHEGGETPRPALSGGDFAAEVCRLGQVTAEMHLAMAEAFGSSPGSPEGDWHPLVASVRDRLAELAPDLVDEAGPVLERIGAVSGPGPALPVHGDYHLGQVMRTDAGWFVLDFEGEPNRSVEERRRPTSPLKDVAGMLRSLHYATRFALIDRAEGDKAHLEDLATAWEHRNRAAFMRGYYDCKGIEDLLPGDEAEREAVRVTFELDKVLYEVAYEKAYRPNWAAIPLSALRRMFATSLEELLTAPADVNDPDGAEQQEDDEELPGPKKG